MSGVGRRLRRLNPNSHSNSLLQIDPFVTKKGVNNFLCYKTKEMRENPLFPAVLRLFIRPSTSRFRSVQCGLGVERSDATRLLSASATILGDSSSVVGNHRLQSSASADGHRLRHGGFLRSSTSTAVLSPRQSDDKTATLPIGLHY